jgi:LmbE family N-acetylglucosaminyl deacetylase
MKKKKLLIIEPHSDDSLIAAGGYLLKHKEQFDYYFCLVTASDLNFHHGPVSRDQRIEEYKNYVQHMGGTWVQPIHDNLQLPLDAESKLDQFNRSLLVRLFEKAIMDIKPDVLMMMGPSFHHDHTIVYESVIAATRPTFSFCPQAIYVLENATYSHKMYPANDLTPNIYVELTEDILAQKAKIYHEIFVSQRRPSGNALSDQGIYRWAKYRGLEGRCELAEAFYQYYGRL